MLDAEYELRIRLAGSDDRGVLDGLAMLDSQSPLRGDALIAELDGIAVAALSLRDGRLVADPFAPTAAVGDHLQLRAASITATKRPTASRVRQHRLAPAR
ncbi:MAG TPA: hypothetical protein VEF89_30380 [Solirubrobacteraceae bacterium]|nr:hypothetical protein [Solirubrobacteraceae bacterium]